VSLISRSRGHLNRNRMTYGEHFAFAFAHGLRCLRAAWYLSIHSLVPAWHERAGSNLVERMAQDFTEHRNAKGQT